jgi:hypothetical protein
LNRRLYFLAIGMLQFETGITEKKLPPATVTLLAGWVVITLPTVTTFVYVPE